MVGRKIKMEYIFSLVGSLGSSGEIDFCPVLAYLVSQMQIIIFLTAQFSMYKSLFPSNLGRHLYRVAFICVCSAQTRTGMGHLRKPPGVELIPAVD
jgi:hypothetical protein